MSNKEKDKDSTRRVRTVKKRKKTSTKKKELDKTRIMSLLDEDDDEPKKVTINRKKSTSSKDGKNTKKGKKKVIKRDKTRTKSGKKKFRYRHPRIATIIRIALIVLILLTIIGIAIAIGSVYGFFGDELKISKEDLVLKYENSIVYDLDGNELATLSSGTKRKSVSMSEMSPYLPKAYVAIEDERFYSHGGVDVLRTGRATVNYVLHAGKSKFGGSTITQQLVKNITEDKEKTSSRKIKEMAKAIQVERLLTKDQILELYLNSIFIGGNDINGVALGAIYYFNKDVKDLSLAQCAFMAGINSQPNYYNPFADRNKDEAGNPKPEAIETAQNKTKVVLAKMLELGSISQDEYNAAVEETNAGLAFSHGDGASTTIEISYHTEAAITQVIDQLMQEKGMTKDMAEVYVLSGGLRIYTTQNTNMQNILENTLTNRAYVITTMAGSKDGNPQQAMTSFTIIDHAKGQVVACGAGTKDDLRKTKLGYFNIPTELRKQTGSSMKPLAVIAPGLESGRLTAATTFIDAPTNFGGYQPKNYYAGYRGSMTMRHAIAISANIPNVKGLSYTGLDYAKEFLGKIGIDNLANEGLGLALGGLENGVSTLQMAEAYSMIANGGLYIEPTFYTRVTDKDGNTILEPHQQSYQMMSPQNDNIEKSILRSVVTSGTATYCAIRGMDVAAKTGTTNDDYDRWLCGFTPYYTAACWYGYEYSAEVYASGNPAGKIWANVMTQVHNGLPGAGFIQPEGIVSAQICTLTGHIASGSCTSRATEIFAEGHLPSACSGHSGGAVICKDSGLLANQYCPNKSTLYSAVSPEEKEGNWTTSGYSNGNAPTATCTIHKAPAPTPAPATPTKPSTSDTTKPNNAAGTNTTKPTNTTTTTPSNTTKPPATNTTPQNKTP